MLRAIVLLLCLALCPSLQSAPPASKSWAHRPSFSPPHKPHAAVVARPHNHILVIIDPGHGGEDFGAESHTKPNYSEKNFNLVTAKHLDTFLKQLGYKTLLTRERDVFVSLDKRAALGTDKDSQIFVSVHYNAAASPQAEGIEVYYYDAAEEKARSNASHDLAQEVLKEVEVATQARSRGVKHGNYHVIRQATIPAILIEGGFLTNPNELAKIKDPAYLKKLAWGAAQGISNYLKKRG